MQIKQVQKCAIRFQYLLAALVSFVVLATAAAQPIPPELYSGLKWRLIGPFRGGPSRRRGKDFPEARPPFILVRWVAGFGKPPTRAWCGSQSSTDKRSLRLAHSLWLRPTPKLSMRGPESPTFAPICHPATVFINPAMAARAGSTSGLRDSRQISKIVVDPQNANVVYVAAFGHAYAPNSERGDLQISRWRGELDKEILDQGPDIGVSDLAIATEDSKLLFATTWRSHRPAMEHSYAPLDGSGSGKLFHSQDSGQSWSRLTGNGLPEGDWGRTAVAVVPNGKRVFLR